MSKLPKSFGLKEKKRSDGHTDLIGKDDSGKEYKAATVGSEVTDADVERLRACDREAYDNPDTRAREAVKRIVGEPEKKYSEMELMHQAMTFDESDWIAAAEPIVHAGFEKHGSTVGSTWAYRKGWDRIFKEIN
jgi:hypothetical protein